jgi:FkbM family methyltransferase
VGEEGKIFAFEPDPTAYGQLVKNIKLNKLSNIIALNKGLWNTNTNLNLYEQFLDGGDSSFFYLENNRKSSEVPVMRLDSEIKKWDLDKIDFIKMDIEGSEIEAIMGCEVILKKYPVNLAIASYHIRNGSQTYIMLEKMLSDLGYKCKTSFPDHLTTYASKDLEV